MIRKQMIKVVFNVIKINALFQVGQPKNVRCAPFQANHHVPIVDQRPGQMTA
jgi:hypothetical protein